MLSDQAGPAVTGMKCRGESDSARPEASVSSTKGAADAPSSMGVEIDVLVAQAAVGERHLEPVAQLDVADRLGQPCLG